MIEQILINDISVYKKHNVTGEYKYFLTNGFGCSTIWFKNPKDAYNLFIKNNKKIPEGRDSELCNICASHYSVFNEKNKLFSYGMCEKYKKEIADTLKIPNKIDIYKNVLYELINKLHDIVSFGMPDKGLKCEDSQKICLLNAINNIEYYVNGINKEDMEATNDDT